MVAVVLLRYADVEGEEDGSGSEVALGYVDEALVLSESADIEDEDASSIDEVSVVVMLLRYTSVEDDDNSGASVVLE